MCGIDHERMERKEPALAVFIANSFALNQETLLKATRSTHSKDSAELEVESGIVDVPRSLREILLCNGNWSEAVARGAINTSDWWTPPSSTDEYDGWMQDGEAALLAWARRYAS